MYVEKLINSGWTSCGNMLINSAEGGGIIDKAIFGDWFVISDNVLASDLPTQESAALVFLSGEVKDRGYSPEELDDLIDGYTSTPIIKRTDVKKLLDQLIIARYV